jgi:hypothetical protein
MPVLNSLGRMLAIVTVVAGIALLTLAVSGMSRVDTGLELAAARQAAPKVVDCPFRERHHAPRNSDREPV